MGRQGQWFVFFVLILAGFSLSGCGETVRGIGKDAVRVGRGIKTIFIAD